MNRPVLRGGLAALLLAAGGCALTFDSTQLGVPISLAEAAQAPPQGTPFVITKHPVFLLWGGATASPPNLEDVLAGQLGTGGRVANLRIKMRASWTDLLVTVISFGLVSPRSVTFEGVVVPGTVSAPAAPPAP